MRKLNSEELRKYQLEILDAVAAFCDKRGINYWLSYGTLIGAVRHKGYIPWDDDIDLSMLRADYDRFTKEFNGYNPRYEFHCIENDPDFHLVFGKVMDKETFLIEPCISKLGIKLNINIDIFVFDNAPDDDKAARKMFSLCRLYNRLNLRRMFPVFDLDENIRKRNFLFRFAEYPVRALLRVFPLRYFIKKAAAASKKYMSVQTKRVGYFNGKLYALIDKEIFSSFVELEFEGRKYKAPAGYDEFLRLIYGDYMQLPPIEERVNHSFTAYVE